MELSKGIEPSFPEYESGVLPIELREHILSSTNHVAEFPDQNQPYNNFDHQIDLESICCGWVPQERDEGQNCSDKTDQDFYHGNSPHEIDWCPARDSNPHAQGFEF